MPSNRVKGKTLRINTNVPSLSNQRVVNNVRQDLEREGLRLASGNKITRAADDPSGLAIAEKMRSKVRSLRQAGRNAADGISLLQVADSTIGNISSNAIRLRELAMSAATDTYSDLDRQNAAREFTGLKKEINRMSSNAEFNGTKVLNGSSKIIELQIGINNKSSEDRISYDLRKALKNIGDTTLSGAGIESKAAAQSSLAAVDQFIGLLNSGRAKIGSIMRRMESVGAGIEISDESHSASRSKIADTDYATSSAERAGLSIRMEAGITVLAQTNKLGKSAARLIE